MRKTACAAIFCALVCAAAAAAMARPEEPEAAVLTAPPGDLDTHAAGAEGDKHLRPAWSGAQQLDDDVEDEQREGRLQPGQEGGEEGDGSAAASTGTRGGAIHRAASPKNQRNPAAMPDEARGDLDEKVARDGVEEDLVGVKNLVDFEGSSALIPAANLRTNKYPFVFKSKELPCGAASGGDFSSQIHDFSLKVSSSLAALPPAAIFPKG